MENHITEYTKRIEEENKYLKEELEKEKGNTELFKIRLQKAIKEHAQEIDFVKEDRKKEIVTLNHIIEELQKELKNTQREYLNKGREEVARACVLLERYRTGVVF